MLRLFVYGTLKRGGRYHQQYCQGLKEATQASLPGRLYLLPQGYPVLVVSPDSVLAMGTSDPLADLDVQARWAARLAGAPGTAPNDLVHGEVLAFDDESLLSGIDALEGFHPAGRSDYHRVLVLPQPPAIGPVWTYVAPSGKLPAGAKYIPGGRWQ